MNEDQIPNFLFSGFSKSWHRWSNKERTWCVLGLLIFWILPTCLMITLSDLHVWLDFRLGTRELSGTVRDVYYYTPGRPSGGSTGPWAEVEYVIDGETFKRSFLIEQEQYKEFHARKGRWV